MITRHLEDIVTLEDTGNSAWREAGLPTGASEGGTVHLNKALSRGDELSGVAGLVLAAGGGRRLGGPKALLRLDGVPLVERALRTVRDGGCAPVVVVLGAGADEVRAQSGLDDDVTVVVNRAWATGLGSSLRAGLAALDGTGAHAALVLLVDMPGISAAAVRRVTALPYQSALVCASYGGRRGHPMLLGRDHWAGISTLAAADVGARPYLLAHHGEVQEIACEDVADDGDVDTPEDAARWGIPLP